MPHDLRLYPVADCHFVNIRTDFNDVTALQQLGESLKFTQIHPIIVRPDGRVIDGERRIRAALLVGLTHLLAVITDDPLTDAEIHELQFASAFHRADLTPWDKSKAMEAMKADHPDWSNRQLADRLAIDPSMVPRLLAVFSCIPAVQEAMQANLIGLKAVYEVAKETDHDRQRALLAQALNGGAEGVAKHRRKLRSGAVATTSRLTSVKCRLTNGVQIIASGEAMSLEGFIESLTDALKQARRARDEGLDAKTFVNVMRDRSRNGA